MEGQGQSKDEWAVKRRMGNQIARLIDEGLFYFLALRHDYFLSGNGVGLVTAEDENLAVTEDFICHFPFVICD